MLTLLALFSPFCMKAQLQLAGIVADSTTKGINGARIYVKNSNVQTVSNGIGVFGLNLSLEHENDSLTFSAPGFYDRSFTIKDIKQQKFFILKYDLRPKARSCEVNLPAVLSPKDADTLTIQSNCTINNISFKLYDRWGILVYEATKLSDLAAFDLNEKIKKDGKKEFKYKEGVYVYILSCLLKDQEKPLKKTGSLTILH